MTHYLLDSNHASPLVTLSHPLRMRVLDAIQSGDLFALTTVNLPEILLGLGTLPRAVQSRMEWARLRPSFRVYTIDEDDAIEAAELQIRLRRRGWHVGTVDALLAVVAMRNNLILLTADRDFDGISELKHENWLTSPR
jgi:predicted nucleic acid-binding protein